MNASPLPYGPIALFALSEGAIREAGFLADLLSAPVWNQAAIPFNPSYVEEGPAALRRAHATAAFRSIAEWPGLPQAIHVRDGDEKARTDVVYALGSAVQDQYGLQNGREQTDLGWAFRRMRGSLVICACVEIFTQVDSEARDLEWFQAEMRRSMHEHREYAIWCL